MADDLQQWLETLKRRAEEQGGGRSSPAQPPRQNSPVIRQAKPKRSREHIYNAELERREEEAERERLHDEVEAKKLLVRKQNEEKRLRKLEALKHEEAQAKKAKLAEMKRKPQARSALGLSGNLINDLRNNPKALREAILLVEILGPPLCERDPFEKIV